MEQLTEGTWVWSRTRQARGKVIEVAELWGTVQLRLWLPKEDVVFVHGEDEVEPVAAKDGGSEAQIGEADIRFAVALGKVAALVNDDKLLAPLNAAVTPLPHQIKALKKLLSRPRVRFLMADEVGLGKTIEAGLAIKELKMRGRVRRILVIAPKGIIPQWLVEMEERFGETFRHFEPAAFETYRQISSEANIWRSHDRVICSMDAVKPLEARRGWSAEHLQAYNQERILDLCAAGWDLIIIDEAHRVAGSADTVARHAMARMLAESTPHMLLLSATPHQGKSDSFHRLMKLLDADAFPEESSVSRDAVKPYVVRTEKRNAVDHRGDPLFTPRLTTLVPVSWRGHDDQQALYEAVTEYVREGYNRALAEKNTSYGFLMILMQRLVTSSTAAIAATLSRRIEALRSPGEQLQLFSDNDLRELEAQDGQSQLEEVLRKQIGALRDERTEVEALYEAAKRVMARGPDAKAEALLEKLFRLQQDEADPDLKLLIFTEFIPTQHMLADYLRQNGFSVVCLNGGMGLNERKAAQKAFAEKTRIMVSTDAGGEGLNLQFCHVVINFDLGWRPMVLEQRIGRVDRIGQKHVVKALNFVLEDSVEFRVREVLEKKLAVIFQEFGINKTTDVLDSEDGARMFDKLFVDALLEPRKVAADVDSVVDVVKREARWNREQLDVLGDTDTGFSMEEAVSTQPVADYIDILVKAHLSAEGGEYARDAGGGISIRWPGGKAAARYDFARSDAGSGGGELLTLDHPKIRALLDKVPRFLEGDRVPTVALADLPGGQDGHWSLWRLCFSTAESLRQEFLPVFTSTEGRAFDRTAHSIWNALLTGEMSLQNDNDGHDDGTCLRRHRELAEQLGEPVFQRLKQAHEAHVRERTQNARRHFEVRFKHLNQIGLPEVRNFRQRQLEMEQDGWKQEIAAEARIHPELHPLILLKIEKASM